MGPQDNFQNLQQALLMAQAVFEEAEDQQVTNKAVKAWLLKLKTAAYDAEDLLDKFAARLKKSDAQEHTFLASLMQKRLHWKQMRSEVMDKLKPLLRGGMDGNKIIITTSNEKVALTTSSPTYPYHLKGLDEDDCWQLFKHQAFPQGEERYEIKKEKLIQMWMAEGLILSDGTRKPLEKIGEEHFQDLMWMSFFQDSGDFDNGDISGYRMHNIIHDLAQSVAGNESIILEKGLPSGSLAQTRHASVICDFKSPEIPQALCEAKHLRTLVLFPGGDTTEFLNQYFKSCPSLRVLDMNRSGLHLVRSIRNFLYLRYLDLSYTLIRFLPYGTVEQLPFLQTLNLCGCYNLKELPLIAKMMSLRHLNISGCESLTAMSPFFAALYKKYGRSLSTTAQHEKFINSTFQPGSSNQLQTLPTIMNANLMEKDCLDSLGLYWREKHDSSILKLMQEDLKPTFFKQEQQQSAGSSEQHQPDANAAEEVVKGLQTHQNLKILVVEGYPGKRFPHWTLPNLTKVDLRDCLNCNCLPVLGNLLFLKTLFLHGMPSLKHIGTEFYGKDTRQLFPSLEELVLSDFLNLQEWLGPDGKDSFLS
ncbi:hypothetical protein GH714_030227 [Hevea brasiliensis]|uniref:Rx N-terminal domain-containing protein n=1 Tax=Hevea brasiliensis TaxID=3981 RepID=A0A6A6N3K1_HEVBR|nr:hypothetical protein GH714_030227 [Hevea brasiliensis]